MRAKKLNKEIIDFKPHIVDVLSSLNRDQVIMKLDKAIDLVNTLDEKTLADEDVVFFDPFCKAGEILLACAIVTLQKTKKRFVSDEEVKKLLYESNRFFGLSLDDRHYRMSMRTFYGNKGFEYKECSLKESLKKGNIGRGSYLEEHTGKFKEEKFKEELNIMLEHIKQKTRNKNIVAIGNPPYNEGKSNIYNKILENIDDQESIKEKLFVIPARWFSGGDGLSNFRSKNMGLRDIRCIKYFNNHLDIFPLASVRGGICFVYRKRNFSGKCKMIHADEGISDNFLVSKYKKQDTIVPHFRAHSILDKINKKVDKFYRDDIHPMNIFNIPTNYFENGEDGTQDVIECMDNSYNRNQKYKLISKSKVSNHELVDLYQVIVPKANGGGKNARYKVLPKCEHFKILNKGKVCTHSFVCLQSFKTKKEAEKFLYFVRTNFVRFLIGIRKPTQDLSKNNFSFVPKLNFSISSEKEIFDYFRITESEKEYIKNKLKYWT